MDEIGAFKAALQVVTDTDLAKALGVDRSTIAQWKRRGAIPDRYYGLLNLDQRPDRLARFYNALRARLFSRPEHHYFLRAALAFLPSGNYSEEEGDIAVSGEYREEAFLALMHLAQLVCRRLLGKPHPESALEYGQIVWAMQAEEAEVIALLQADMVPQSVPQSRDQRGAEAREALKRLASSASDD